MPQSTMPPDGPRGKPAVENRSASENSASFQSASLPTRRSLGEILRIMGSLLALLLITAGSFWAALDPSWVQAMGRWGYLGVALISFTSSATVILPAPGLAVVFSMGGVFNPITLGIIAGIASGLGELSGYVAGASGRLLVSQEGGNPFLQRFATRYTALALFVLAILPLPVFDFVGILAGAMRMRVPLFLGMVIPGKIIKHILIALAGGFAAHVAPLSRLLTFWDERETIHDTPSSLAQSSATPCAAHHQLRRR